MKRKWLGLLILIAIATSFIACASFAGTMQAGFAKGSPEYVAFTNPVARDVAANGYFGWAVGTSEDGSIYAASAPFYAKENKDDGSFGDLVIFYSAEDNLVLSSTIKDSMYGASVSVSDDGTIIVVGSPGLNPQSDSKATIYRMPKEGWGEGDAIIENKLVISGGVGTRMGMSASMSSKAQTIAIGAPGDEGKGRVYYYIMPDVGWLDGEPEDIEQGYLGIGKAVAGDEFGRSVAISKDDSTMVVGAPGRNGGKGSVYVFTKPETGWLDIDKLTAIDPNGLVPGDRFGEKVAVSSDGSIIVVGAPCAKNGAGRLFIYTKTGDNYDLQVYTGATGFGCSVDISGDGQLIAAGSYGTNLAGSLTFLKVKESSWDDVLFKDIELKPGYDKYQAAMFGFSLDLLDDGTKALVGAPFYKNGTGYLGWSKTD